MILVLNTPYNPGDADKGNQYTHLHIDTLVYNANGFTVTVAFTFGNLDANQEYVPGKASQRITEVTSPEELYEFATSMSANGEPALITAQRLSYQFLVNHRNYPGTIDLTLPKDPAYDAMVEEMQNRAQGQGGQSGQ